MYQLPFVSLDAPREDLGLNNNYNWGAGINLRGLGVGATLVLVNGHRQPLSGLNGDFVDVSNIPAAAVERIEILPDGASALYGSDAIAGVVNIILKDDFQGAETQVRYGGTPGGRDETVVSQLLGTHWTGGKAMLVYEYSDATALAASARGYAANADKLPYGGADYRSYYSDPGNILNPSTLQPIYGIPRGLNGLRSLHPAVYRPSICRIPSLNTNCSRREPNTASMRQARRKWATTSSCSPKADSRQRNTYVQTFPGGLKRSRCRATIHSIRFPARPRWWRTASGQFLGPATFAVETRNYMGTVGARFKFGRQLAGNAVRNLWAERLLDNEYNLVQSDRSGRGTGQYQCRRPRSMRSAGRRTRRP